ncbi:uncharacterized protein DS421_10g306170 [Arachis hypogaea]|nr:uncharacterized protein DS421_10g306170 [Arachis hypogaea]
MKSKSTKAPEKLSDRAAEEESFRNHLCLLKLQLAELKEKRSYVTVNFHRSKVTPIRRRGGYEHFYRIRFFIGVTDLKKSKSKTLWSWRFSLPHSRFLSFLSSSVTNEEK